MSLNLHTLSNRAGKTEWKCSFNGERNFQSPPETVFRRGDDALIVVRKGVIIFLNLASFLGMRLKQDLRGTGEVSRASGVTLRQGHLDILSVSAYVSADTGRP